MIPESSAFGSERIWVQKDLRRWISLYRRPTDVKQGPTSETCNLEFLNA